MLKYQYLVFTLIVSLLTLNYFDQASSQDVRGTPDSGNPHDASPQDNEPTIINDSSGGIEIVLQTKE